MPSVRFTTDLQLVGIVLNDAGDLAGPKRAAASQHVNGFQKHWFCRPHFGRATS